MATVRCRVCRVRCLSRKQTYVYCCYVLFYPVADHAYTAYTDLKGPVAWMAPETFDEGEKGRLVSPASDMYMLGSCFVEVATGCERQPFDWLTPQRTLVYRVSDATRGVSCIQVSVNNFVKLVRVVMCGITPSYFVLVRTCRGCRWLCMGVWRI